MEKFDLFVHKIWILSLCLLQLVHTIDISQKYFTDVVLICNESSSQNASEPSGLISMNRIWLLPDGSIVRKGQKTIDLMHVQLSEHGDVSTLHITKIDDVNFGVYWCIQVWNDSSISVIRHTVNIDGPPMHEFYEQQKKNAIVGAIAAGAVLGIIVLTYVIWFFTCSEKVRRKRRLAEDLSKGVNRYSTQIYDNVGMDLYVKRTE